MKNGISRLHCFQLLLLDSSSCQFPSLFWIHWCLASKWLPQSSLHLLPETEGQERNFRFPWVTRRAWPQKRSNLSITSLKGKQMWVRLENKEKWKKKLKGSKRSKGRKTRNKKEEGKRNRKWVGKRKEQDSEEEGRSTGEGQEKPSPSAAIHD